MPALDIAQIISQAKLGSTRKDAQIDACEPFAAALFDVLSSAQIDATVCTATFRLSHRRLPLWAHAVIQSDGIFYDSMGVFNHDVVRKRQRIHKNVRTELKLEKDIRDFNEKEWSEMHKFYFEALSKSLNNQKFKTNSQSSKISPPT